MLAVKTALIGFGHLGRFHAQKIALLEEAEFVAIVEASEAGRERARSEYPNIAIVESLEQLPDGVEAAIVVTPTSLHFDICQKLVAKGIHVFCEKPMTDRLQDALSLKEQVLAKKVLFQVGHSERCHEAWEKRELFTPYLTSGAHLRLDRYAAFKGRATDVDVVNDLMIHDLDLLCFLIGEAPISVAAKGYKQRTDHWDHVVATLKWKNDMSAHITVGRGHVYEVRSFEVVNQAGVLRVDLMNTEIQIATAKGTEVEKISYTKRDHLLLEQQAFYQAIRGKRSVMVDLAAGVTAVTLVDAVLRSLASGQEVELA